MFRWLAFCLVLVACFAGAAIYLFGNDAKVDSQDRPGSTKSSNRSNNGPSTQASTASTTLAEIQQQAPVLPDWAEPRVVIANSQINAKETQNVSSQHDGKLLVIATDLKDGEIIPTTTTILKEKVGLLGIKLNSGEISADEPLRKGDKRYRRWVSGDPVEPNTLAVFVQERKYRQLEVGDEVARDQLLAIVDPVNVQAELSIKIAEFDASEAKHKATVATYEETQKRYETAEILFKQGGKVISYEDFRAAGLARDKYFYESIQDENNINEAREKVRQVNDTLKLHDIRSSIDGRITAIYKHRGESIKGTERSGEVILQIQNDKVLRIEGQVDAQYAANLHPGEEVVVEPFPQKPFQECFIANQQQINSISVSKSIKDKDVEKGMKIVTGGDDHYARVWDRHQKTPIASFKHTSPVWAVACTPNGAEQNYCLTGTQDGSVRLWNLSNLPEPAVREMTKGHTKAVLCAAFDPTGKRCATGGEDNTICIWNTETGDLIDRLTAHRGRVTTVQFLPNNRLLSAASDTMLLLWELNDEGKPVAMNKYEHRRSGHIPSLSADPNTHQVLLDWGTEIHLVSADGLERAKLTNNASGANFTTLALFSPDGKVILTNGNDNRLQLWRAPNPETHGYELCQYNWDGTSNTATTCGAFAPDGSFAVTGTNDGHVLVWAIPAKEEVERQLKAKIVSVVSVEEGTTKKFRVQAQMDNPGDLHPGYKATMVLYPVKK
jgi:WD40 repeat protein